MTRYTATLTWELRLHYRQGLYWAALAIVAVWVLILGALPEETRDLLFPYILFMDLSVFGFYFMAGILYLEKGDGVLEALVVTPLPRGGYLLTKLLALTLLALVATLATTLLVHGPGGVNWFYLVAGTVFNSWLLTLVGFLIAVRYDAINEFFVPSIVYLIPTQLPLLDYFDIWDSWLIYLMPTQGAMLLLQGAFEPIAGWQVLYSFAILIASCAVVTWLALRAYDRFVVEKV